MLINQNMDMSAFSEPLILNPLLNQHLKYPSTSTNYSTLPPLMSTTTNIPTTKNVVKVGFYEVESTIGKGNYAVVKLARHRITKTEVVLNFY